MTITGTALPKDELAKYQKFVFGAKNEFKIIKCASGKEFVI